MNYEPYFKHPLPQGLVYPSIEVNSVAHNQAGAACIRITAHRASSWVLPIQDDPKKQVGRAVKRTLGRDYYLERAEP
jgi:hypothetical protein